ncbi:LacI family DNA-binding transcriptional regulator [Streptomyces sp. MnatMP-M17]|uniref:LacI family DNA-binding transcriptional regulator n=1 Tax=unclassified Streptomyces TaxID=2593676 RepID=UPI00081EE0FE|nr:LacI family DNA-binding transcriptional regulator [Streptomyces sp. MnatMP-M17]MYZ36454.1 substrate-binding domain-containing protein [Streptomyces sp. SID4917]SCF83692.1 transcriptional regulator, LacI family [Streptomyces sp. MnatMP-M17]
MTRAPRKRTGRITMQEVATRAGVSLATASFAINGTGANKVSEETRRRVQGVADELGYRPNAMAQNLSRARSSFIGFITDSVATTPFAGEMIRGVQNAARENGYVMLMANTESDPHAFHDVARMMLDHQVHGVVYSTWYHRQVATPIGLSSIPVVLANCYTRDDRLQSFVPDEAGGGRAATEILTARGHRRIAFINSDQSAPATTGRLRGYREALHTAGIPFDRDLVLTTAPEQEGGYAAGLRMLQLDPRPTAVFCYNDRVAMGLYDALRTRGLSIPQDMAVVGFDNQEVIAAHLRPALTTVALPHYQIGYRSLDWLLREGAPTTGDAPQPSRTLIPCPTVERSST